MLSKRSAIDYSLIATAAGWLSTMVRPVLFRVRRFLQFKERRTKTFENMVAEDTFENLVHQLVGVSLGDRLIEISSLPDSLDWIPLFLATDHADKRMLLIERKFSPLGRCRVDTAVRGSSLRCATKVIFGSTDEISSRRLRLKAAV